MDLNPSTLKNLVCKKCESHLWVNTFKMKVIPAALSKSGRDDVIPHPQACCYHCGALFEDIADMTYAKSDDEHML